MTTIAAALAMAELSQCKKYTIPELGNSPRIDPIRNKEGVQGRPIKVFITAIIPGSTQKNQLETAKGLSKERDENGNPKYDITILTTANNKKVKTSDNVHKVEIPIDAKDIILDGKGKTPSELMEMMKKVQVQQFILFNESRDVMDKMKDMQFDIALVVLMPIDSLIAKYLEVPMMIWSTLQPETMTSMFTKTPHQSSSTLPLMGFNAEIADGYPSHHLLFRFPQLMVRNVFHNLLPLLYSVENFGPDYSQEWLTGYDLNTLFGFGFAGLREPSQ